MKTCTRCKTEKPLFDFSPDKRLKSGVQSCCKNCFAEMAQIKRAENPQPHRDSIKRSTQKHYEKKLARNRRYRAAQPEKVKAWKQKDRTLNKSRILADNAKRRALFSEKLTVEVKQVYALRDFYQAMSLGEVFHVDHVVPLSKGGRHVYENLQVIPAIDNLRKGANL